MRPAISVTVDVVIFTLREGDLQVLLVKRKHPPYEGRWAIPGGYVEADESLADAAARELFEETHVQGMHIEQFYTFGEPLRDPRGRVITVAYLALLPAPVAVEAGDDAAEAQWISVANLPALAFDHNQIVEHALQRLREKLVSSEVGSQLLPAPFTLSDLQQLHEIVLGEKLDPRSFRRRILQTRLLEATGENRVHAGRPVRLYRFIEGAVAEVQAQRLCPCYAEEP